MQTGPEITRQIEEKKTKEKKERAKYHPFEYPVVIKAYEGKMTFSIPDIHYFKVIDLPKGQLTPEYLHLMAKNLAQCWLKTQENLARLNEYEVKPPSPTYIKDLLKKRKYKRLGISAVAALLKKSVCTVRRMADRGELKCRKTEKGTRYFLERDILKFLDN